jgi:hypothetical protein
MAVDAETLISRLSAPLEPADRSAFRHAAEVALAAPGIWGEGLAYRVLVPLWRQYFHPPPDDRSTSWDIANERSHGPTKLIGAPPIGHSRRNAR